MPEVDGYELIRQIRSMPSQADLLAIALTAYAGEFDRQQAREAGFSSILLNPSM